jgi:hypothetical protein
MRKPAACRLQNDARTQQGCPGILPGISLRRKNQPSLPCRIARFFCEILYGGATLSSFGISSARDNTAADLPIPPRVRA